MLYKEFLEKISKINELANKINNYWVKIELSKCNKYNCLEIEVHIYTFLEENGVEDNRLAYILNKKVDLTETTAIQELEYIIEKMKELIHATNEND